MSDNSLALVYGKCLFAITPCHVQVVGTSLILELHIFYSHSAKLNICFDLLYVRAFLLIILCV